MPHMNIKKVKTEKQRTLFAFLTSITSGMGSVPRIAWYDCSIERIDFSVRPRSILEDMLKKEDVMNVVGAG